MSYTKGPWEKKVFGDSFAVFHERGERVAYCYGAYASNTREEAEANARLIAAAPELLEACKEFLESFEPYEEDSDKDTRRLLATMRAVVAKAEGRQP